MVYKSDIVRGYFQSISEICSVFNKRLGIKFVSNACDNNEINSVSIVNRDIMINSAMSNGVTGENEIISDVGDARDDRRYSVNVGGTTYQWVCVSNTICLFECVIGAVNKNISSAFRVLIYQLIVYNTVAFVWLMVPALVYYAHLIFHERVAYFLLFEVDLVSCHFRDLYIHFQCPLLEVMVDRHWILEVKVAIHRKHRQ